MPDFTPMRIAFDLDDILLSAVQGFPTDSRGECGPRQETQDYEAAHKEAARAILREIDYITVYTAISGAGRGRRHRFERGEVHFQQVWSVTSKSNLRLLVQSQTAYH